MSEKIMWFGLLLFQPKWWSCETPLDTPDGNLNEDEAKPFGVFQLETGWFFWDYNCDQVFGPDTYENTIHNCHYFYTFLNPNKVK